MANVRQLSFSSGEITPALYARVDLVKYATGLKTLENFWVMRHGGVANRPGTKYIAEVKDSSKAVRLIPFVFNAGQTYILEFGNLYMRVYKDGAQLQSGGSPYEITTPYVEADLPELQYVQSADVVTLVHPNYAPRDLARTGDTTWTLTTITFGATIATPTGLASSASGTAYYYKVTAVSATTNEESLPTAAVGSSTQTSTLTWTAVTGAGFYNIYKLSNGEYGWIGLAGAVASPSFVDATFTPDMLDTPPVDRQPFTGTGNYPSAVAYYQQRRIFANTDNNPEGIWTSKSALRKNFMVSTPLQDDDAITFAMAGRQVNEIRHLVEAGKFIAFTASGEWTIEGDAAGVLTPSAINPKQYTANGSGSLPPLVAGGSALYVQARGSVVRDLAYEFESQGYRGNELSIFAAHLIDSYTLKDWAYQQIPHSIVWAVRSDGKLIGLTYVREHVVIGWHRHAFDGVVENVCVVPEGTEDALYLVVKRTINSILNPSFEVNTSSWNTASSWWINDGAVLTRDTSEYKDGIASARIATGTGATQRGINQQLNRTWLAGVPYTLKVWVKSNTSTASIRVFFGGTTTGGNIQQDINLSTSWQQVTLVWTPTATITLAFAGVKNMPDTDITFFVDNWQCNYDVKRYVERIYTRRISDIRDAVFVDCALSYDGRNTGATTMTLSGGTNWTYDENLTLTASVSYFVSGDVGNEIWLTGSDGTVIRCKISAYTSGTVVTVSPHKTVPVAMRGAAITNWSKAVDEISGLNHLEGKKVSILGDGFVVANPNNSSYTEKIVVNGAVTLDKPYAVIHAGLPITADMETLNIDVPQGQSLADKKKNVGRLTIFTESSRGIWAGPDADNLTELKIRDDESYDDPVELATGTVELNIKPEWNSTGKIMIRQTDPLPLSILAVVPAGYLAT